MYNEQNFHPGDMDVRPDAMGLQNLQYGALKNTGDVTMPAMESPQRLQFVEPHVVEACAASIPEAQSFSNYSIVPEMHGTPNLQNETAHSFSEFAMPDREDHMHPHFEAQPAVDEGV